jgi:NAD(P)-dependent dehydrogenase (short-subunit alcohol dehydrogenase family)
MSGLSLDSRVAVISGAGKGLGRSFALQLARLGAKVVVNNRNRIVDDSGRGPADHVVAEIVAGGGEAVADHHDAADTRSGEAMVQLALERWGRLDICVANAGVGHGGIFHKESDAEFESVLAINLFGAARLTRAATRVMREAGYGRIVLVSSTGGLHGDVGLSAYAASKGAMLALGRSLAAEGERRGVLTNLLLPYAATQMTESDMAEEYVRATPPDAVTPVLTALVDEHCTLNGELIVTGGGLLRSASMVEWGTVRLPSGDQLSPDELATLLAQSKKGPPKEFAVSIDSFFDLMESGAE